MQSMNEAVEADELSAITIEAVARGFFREANTYGFRPPDYVRFMSALLHLTNSRIANTKGPAAAAPPAPSREGDVPRPNDPITIRPFQPAADMETVLRWLEDPNGRQFLPCRAGGTASFQDIVEDHRSVIGIVTLSDETPLGVTAFLDYDPVQRKAELRKLIGEPRLRGKGYGKAATRLWLRYGFESLNLHKVYLSTLDTNIRNIRLNEHLGFRLEGILRDEILIDGRYHDVLRMGIWRTDDACL